MTAVGEIHDLDNSLNLTFGNSVPAPGQPADVEYKQGQQIFELNDSVSAVQFHGDLLYAATYYGEVLVLDPQSGEPVDRFVCTVGGQPLPIACFDVAARFVVVGSLDGTVALFDMETKQVTHVWQDHKEKVSQVQIFEHKNLVYSTGHDGYFYIRNYEFDKLVHSFISCTCPLSSFATEGTDVVYLGAWDGHVKKVELKARTCVQIVTADPNENSPVRALAIAPQPPPPPPLAEKKVKGKKGKPKYDPLAPPMVLFVAHGIGKIKSWDLAEDRLLVDCYQGHADIVNCLRVHRNVLYTAGEDCSIRLYDILKGSCLEVLHGHGNGITGLACHKEQLATASFDRTIREYNISAIEQAVTQKLLRAEQRKKEAYEAWLASKEKKKKGKKKGSKKGGSKKKGSKKGKKKKK